MYSTRLRAFYTPLIAFLPNLGLAAVLLVGGRQVVHGSISLGEFVTFNTYMLMLMSPMRMLGIALGMSQRAVASGNRVFEILDTTPEIRAPEHPVPLPPGGGHVQFRDATPLLRRRSARARGRRPRRGGRRDGRDRRADRLGEDDAGGHRRAALRPDAGQRGDRRRRRARAGPGGPAAQHRAGPRRRLPVLRLRAGEHRLRAAGGLARRGARRGAQGSDRLVHRDPAQRLRHARRRAGHDALRRPAPADRHRAGDRRRPARR